MLQLPITHLGTDIAPAQLKDLLYSALLSLSTSRAHANLFLAAAP